jgi:hypothetical protein
MLHLAHQRCFNHGDREAVARCLGCGQFFCRECVTEHDDRVVCAACLRKLAKTPARRRRAIAFLLGPAQCAAGILMAWFFFFLVGEYLQSRPNSTHKNAIWKVNWADEK